MVTVAISLVRATVDELERQHVDSAALLARVGLNPAVIEDASTRIPLATYDAFQRLALEVTGDAAFGLHLGEHASLASFSTLGHMVAQCRTIGEAIDLGLQYYRLVADVAAAPSLVERGDDVWFQYEYLRSEDPLLDRLRAEFGLTRILAIARLLLGDATLPTETWFEHDAPEYAGEYARIFGCRLSRSSPASSPRSVVMGPARNPTLRARFLAGDEVTERETPAARST